MKKLLLIISLLGLSPSFAGTKKINAGDQKAQVAKLNLFALVARNFSVQYEYAFHKNMSGALGLRWMLPYSADLAKFLGADGSGTGATLGKLKFTGYAITPEFRFYPGKKVEHQAPHGFYIAPYARYGSFSMNTSITIPSDTAANFVGGPIDAKITYSGFGGGLMFGAQWVFKNHISLDWWILGLHYGSSNVKITAEGDLLAQTGGTTEVKGSLDDLVSNDLPFNATSNITVGARQVSGKVSGIPFTGMRCGLSLGYNF